MNYKIRKLQDDIIAMLNASDIPIEAKRLILADLLNIVTNESTKIIAMEIKEVQKKDVVSET